jgi:O-antigen/teichoic acid export membrane protein
VIPDQAASEPNILDDVDPADLRRNSSWDVANAPKNYISLLVAHGGTALFSFTSVWLIIKTLGPGSYGGVIAFVAASQLVQIFLNWSSTALTRFGLEEFVETGKISRSFWSRSLIYGPNLLLAIAAASFWLPAVANGFKITEGAAWLILLHIVTSSIWFHVQSSLQAIKRLKLQGYLLAMERLLILLSIVGLIAANRLNLIAILWCYVLPPIIMATVGLYYLTPHISLSGGFDRVKLRSMLWFSLPLIPFAIVGYLSTNQLDAYFLTNYMSEKDLGIYGVAAQLNGMVLQLPILANSILMSLFVSLRTGKQDDASQRFFVHVLPTLVLGWTVVCAVAAFSAGIVIPIFFGTDFTVLGPTVWVLLAASAASGPALLGYSAFSHAISATYISAIAATAAAAINITFDILLIPRYGLVGCAMATLLAAAGLNLVVIMLCRRRANMRISWVAMSVMPAIGGMAAMLLTGMPVVAFLTSLAAAVIVFLIFRESVTTAFRTITRRKAQA